MDFHDVSHWACVVCGLLLVITGIISRLHGKRTLPSGGDVVLKRVTLVLVGMVGVVYGAYRLTH